MEIVMIGREEESARAARELKLYPERRNESREIRSRRIVGMVAMGRNSEIGRNGDLPWHLPEDLARFKSLTIGNAVIMGRHTWDSLPRSPLPGRMNIVLSRNKDFDVRGGIAASNLREAIGSVPQDIVPFIIGGAAVYETSLPYLTDLYITDVDLDVEDADTFFPCIDRTEWDETECGEWQISKTGIRYRYRRLTRK